MSFVRDDHAHTRGVGAVAAMDRNPRRRRAAAIEALGMVRRDHVMAQQTLGAIKETGGRGTVIGIRGVETGVLDRPPVTHLPLPGGTGGGGRPPVRQPVKPTVAGPRVLVKSPGAVIRPPVRGGGGRNDAPPGKTPGTTPPTKNPFTGNTTTFPEPPPKLGTVTTYGNGGSSGGGGGGGGSSGGGGGPTNDAPIFLPDEDLDLPTDLELVVPVAPQVAPRSNMLMYAAIGVGVWYLFLRKK